MSSPRLILSTLTSWLVAGACLMRAGCATPCATVNGPRVREDESEPTYYPLVMRAY